MKTSKGFTLVEMMIAIGLFTVIMTIGIGAIIGVNATHRKTQTMRAVIDNLSFLMEDMARSIRLGDSYYCNLDGAPDYSDLANLSDPQNPQASQDGGSGANLCDSISFEPFWNPQLSNVSNQVIYYMTEIDGVGTIVKKTDTQTDFSPSDWDPVTPVEMNIDLARSGFRVTGAEDPSDARQPKVSIVLVGTVRLSGAFTEFNLQTTVSQRSLDVNIIP
mgnify:FL=1